MEKIEKIVLGIFIVTILTISIILYKSGKESGERWEEIIERNKAEANCIDGCFNYFDITDKELEDNIMVIKCEIRCFKNG